MKYYCNQILAGLILVLCVLIVWRTTKKENFTTDAELLLKDFMGTMQAQTNEVKSILKVDGNVAKTDKELHVGGNNFNLFRNSGKDLSQHRGSMGLAGDGTMHIHGMGPHKKMVLLDNVDVHKNLKVKEYAEIDKELKLGEGIKVSQNGNDKSDHRGGIGFWENALQIHGMGPEKKVRINNQICIGGTCINEDHLKMLKGEKSFYLQSDWHRRFLDSFFPMDIRMTEANAARTESQRFAIRQ